MGVVETELIEVDKAMLKMLIIEMKDNGNSFQQISDSLKDKYGVIKTRQAVCGLYNRAISESQLQKDRKVMVGTVDIVNYASLGLSPAKIALLIPDFTEYRIKSILATSRSHIDNLENEHLITVKDMILSNSDMTAIRNKLKYKEIVPTDTVINRLIQRASKLIVEEQVKELSIHILKLTDNLELAKAIASDNNVDLSAKDISVAMNKYNV